MLAAPAEAGSWRSSFAAAGWEMNAAAARGLAFKNSRLSIDETFERGSTTAATFENMLLESDKAFRIIQLFFLDGSQNLSYARFTSCQGPLGQIFRKPASSLGK